MFPYVHSLRPFALAIVAAATALASAAPSAEAPQLSCCSTSALLSGIPDDVFVSWKPQPNKRCQHSAVW